MHKIAVVTAGKNWELDIYLVKDLQSQETQADR